MLTKKHISPGRQQEAVFKNFTRVIYPAQKAISDLTMYLDHIEEFYARNIESIDRQIRQTSEELIEVEVEDGSTIMVSERELAIDYYEEGYYEDSQLHRGFLMEGFIFKAHQKLENILVNYCRVVAEKAEISYHKFQSGYKKSTPGFFIRSEYLRHNLLQSSDLGQKQFKQLNNQLEKIAIIRNCLIHENGRINEKSFIPKVQSLFSSQKCGTLDKSHTPQLIVLNNNYPQFLLDFLKEYTEFVGKYLLNV